MSLTERLPCPVYPTMVLFNVFAAAAEERNVAETITKQLFSPDNKDNRNVMSGQGTLPGLEGDCLQDKVLACEDAVGEFQVPHPLKLWLSKNL